MARTHAGDIEASDDDLQSGLGSPLCIFGLSEHSTHRMTPSKVYPMTTIGLSSLLGPFKRKMDL